MAQQDTTKYHVAMSLLALTVATIGSFVPGMLPGAEVSLADQAIFGVALFIAIELLDMVYLLVRLDRRQAHEHHLWDVRDTGDVLLAQTRHYFAKVVQDSEGEDDVFVRHFLNEFEPLLHRIRIAAETQDVEIGSDFFMNADSVFAALRNDKERVVRYTWPIHDDEKLFGEEAWRHSFEVTARMVQGKEVAEVRAILVLDRPESIEIPRISKLLDFYKTTKGQSCKVMTKESYDRICDGHKSVEKCLDFGVYGRSLLFRSVQYQPEYVGRYTKQRATIEKYQRLFDEMWNSPANLRPNPSKETKRVSLEDLFDEDDRA